MTKPKAPVRRFDVFAEYNRQQAIKEGMSTPQAKGYGLWLAKIVAARRSMPKPSEGEGGEKKGKPKPRWRSLSGKPQTDKLFDKEIVVRMGRTFYAWTFVPAIRKAIENGEDYRDIRDSIRKDWQP